MEALALLVIAGLFCTTNVRVSVLVKVMRLAETAGAHRARTRIPINTFKFRGFMVVTLPGNNKLPMVYIS